MAHPNKKAGTDSHNAKLERMTRGYGLASGPANNKTAPTNKFKGEGPEGSIGFGADSTQPEPGGVRQRRGAVANPVATLKKGGKAAKKYAHGGAASGVVRLRRTHHEDGDGAATGSAGRGTGHITHGDGGPTGSAGPGRMGMSKPKSLFGGRGDGTPTGSGHKRASGGRTKGKGHGNVNIIIDAGGKGAGPGAAGVMPGRPPVTAVPPILPAGAPPAVPPPRPPMGAGPMAGGPPGALPMAPGAPGGIPPGLIPPRKRGGRVHDDAKEDKALIKKTLKEEGLKPAEHKHADGGSVIQRMTGGALSGIGRLEKMHEGGKPKRIPPQVV
jgi:hypothetical protein